MRFRLEFDVWEPRLNFKRATEGQGDTVLLVQVLWCGAQVVNLRNRVLGMVKGDQVRFDQAHRCQQRGELWEWFHHKEILKGSCWEERGVFHLVSIHTHTPLMQGPIGALMSCLYCFLVFYIITFYNLFIWLGITTILWWFSATRQQESAMGPLHPEPHHHLPPHPIQVVIEHQLWVPCFMHQTLLDFLF